MYIFKPRSGHRWGFCILAALIASMGILSGGVAQTKAQTQIQAQAQAPVQTDDPDFLSFAAGAYDWNRQKDMGVEFRMEYRSDWKLWQFKPFVAMAGTSTGSGFFGAGILMDVYFGRRLVVTPSFAPHLYIGGNKDLDLGYPIEFRSQLEIAYRFDDRSRLGLAISHYSNASLSDNNPGTESLMLYYSVPFSKLVR